MVHSHIVSFCYNKPMDSLKSQIEKFKPYDEREASDRELTLYCIDAFPQKSRLPFYGFLLGSQLRTHKSPDAFSQY